MTQEAVTLDAGDLAGSSGETTAESQSAIPAGTGDNPESAIVDGGSAGGGGTTVTVYFKMRALQDPGPGYHVWTVTGAPDFTGTNAPGAIQGGTAIVAETWTI